MGADKTAQKSESTVTATPEERALEANQLSINKAGTQDQIDLNHHAASLALNLLQGNALPGYLNRLPGGISEQDTQGMVNKSLKDIAPSFQSAGILDSGVAAQIGSRTSADVRNQNAQFNIQNLMQLLNLASGSSAQVQAPMLNNSAQLGSNLAGLRSTNTNSSTSAMNPFLKSFQTSLGQNLGSFRMPVGNSGAGFSMKG